jgi:hypothetical protein
MCARLAGMAAAMGQTSASAVSSAAASMVASRAMRTIPPRAPRRVRRRLSCFSAPYSATPLGFAHVTATGPGAWRKWHGAGYGILGKRSLSPPCRGPDSQGRLSTTHSLHQSLIESVGRSIDRLVGRAARVIAPSAELSHVAAYGGRS